MSMNNIDFRNEKTILIPADTTYLKNCNTTPILEEVLKKLPSSSIKNNFINKKYLNKMNKQKNNKNIMLQNASSNDNSSGINPDDAIEIVSNTAYNLTNFSSGNLLFLKYNVTNIKKYSAIIQFNDSTNADVIIFSLDEFNNPTIITNSFHLSDKINVASFIPNTTETYYIFVIVNSGGGDAAFAMLESDNHSSHEPNDNPIESPAYQEYVSVVDTYDNDYDVDFIRHKVTKSEPMAIAFAFEDKHLTGYINFGIYHKEDENGNAVNQWIINETVSVPVFTMLWENNLKGEFYIYTTYAGGDILNKPYTLSITPVSSLPKPTYVSTGEKGMTGVQSGYVNGYHWVMGAFKVIADFRRDLPRNADGAYPRFATQMFLVGKDKDGNYDSKNNMNSSGPIITSSDGITTISALLPGSYGNDGAFHGAKYTHKFDWNRVYFAFLTYTKKNGDNKPGLYWEISDIYCDFSPFMNVLD